MTSVDGVSRLADLIRQRVSSAGTQHADGKSGAQRSTRKTTEPPSFSHLVDRVSTIDPLDPDKERTAFRFLLEAALLTEFGMDLINAPKFYQLVDKVQMQMESHPKTAAGGALGRAVVAEDAAVRLRRF